MDKHARSIETDNEGYGKYEPLYIELFSSFIDVAFGKVNFILFDFYTARFDKALWLDSKVETVPQLKRRLEHPPGESAKKMYKR